MFKPSKGRVCLPGSPDSFYKPRVLLPHLKKLPAKRVVNLPNITDDPLRLTLSFDAAAGGLPPGYTGPLMARYEVRPRAHPRAFHWSIVTQAITLGHARGKL